MAEDPVILTEASRRTGSRQADMAAAAAVVATQDLALMDQEDHIRVTGV